MQLFYIISEKSDTSYFLVILFQDTIALRNKVTRSNTFKSIHKGSQKFLNNFPNVLFLNTRISSFVRYVFLVIYY